jgi:hypothetical protein
MIHEESSEGFFESESEENFQSHVGLQRLCNIQNKFSFQDINQAIVNSLIEQRISQLEESLEIKSPKKKNKKKKPKQP